MSGPAFPFAPVPGFHLREEDALALGPERAPRRLVLLHGWGADADDLLDLGQELLAPELAAGTVSVVALRAPLPHPGGAGRQWYDLLPQPDWSQLPAARQGLRARLEALAASVPLERTALLGFSQGAAMAVDVALGEDGLPVPALIACSGYPHPGWRPAPLRTRVLLTHGEQDPMVPFMASTELEQLLGQAAATGSGAALRRLSFPGGHGIDPALFPAMRSWLEAGWG